MCVGHWSLPRLAMLFSLNFTPIIPGRLLVAVCIIVHPNVYPYPQVQDTYSQLQSHDPNINSIIFHGWLPPLTRNQTNNITKLTEIPICSYHGLLFPITIKINGIRPAFQSDVWRSLRTYRSWRRELNLENCPSLVSPTLKFGTPWVQSCDSSLPISNTPQTNWGPSRGVMIFLIGG